MFSVAKIFGPHAVAFLPNDDEARVPFGIKAPILMHLDYKVTLPAHLLVVAPSHKLIPSMYGVYKIRDNGEVSCSGEIFEAQNMPLVSLVLLISIFSPFTNLRKDLVCAKDDSGSR